MRNTRLVGSVALIAAVSLGGARAARADDPSAAARVAAEVVPASGGVPAVGIGPSAAQWRPPGGPVPLGARQRPPAPEPRRRSRIGLMIAGWATFVGSYLLSALVGLEMMSGSATGPGEVCLNCDTVGPRLLIPLVGPFLAIPEADGTDGKVVVGLLGSVQAIGLLLGTIGTALFAIDRAAIADERLAGLTLSDEWRLSVGAAVVDHVDGVGLVPTLQLGSAF